MTLPVHDALAALPVREENRTGYERTKFKHGTDADHGGCNTRAEVLKDEAVTAPEQGPNCTPTGGEGYSPTTTASMGIRGCPPLCAGVVTQLDTHPAAPEGPVTAPEIWRANSSTTWGTTRSAPSSRSASANA
ncbi:hypothetical protein ABZ468_35860 [Streptomyces sp. NPDC005708]|uniref:hypothetical protein n=1 Tax=Streptomyces sp. NPDC005708 TaxID=3154564 RepID=UPI0034026402